MGVFARGKQALAISDRSGLRFPYTEMVREWNGMSVHKSEYEAKQPQLQPRPHGGDAQALQNSRTDAELKMRSYYEPTERSHILSSKKIYQMLYQMSKSGILEEVFNKFETLGIVDDFALFAILKKLDFTQKEMERPSFSLKLHWAFEIICEIGN